MSYCYNCNNPVNYGVPVCMVCGAPQGNPQSYLSQGQPPMQSQPHPYPPMRSQPSSQPFTHQYPPTYPPNPPQLGYIGQSYSTPYPANMPGYSYEPQPSTYPQSQSENEDEMIKPSQGLILTILFGVISGAMMIVGLLQVWVFDSWVDNGVNKTLNYTVNISYEFMYLYIILILGFLVLLMSILLPLLQHKIPNPRFFAVLILLFCIIVLITAIGGIQHMTSVAHNPQIGPGGVVCMIGAIFGVPASFLFMRTLRNTGPLLDFKPTKRPDNILR